MERTAKEILEEIEVIVSEARKKAIYEFLGNGSPSIRKGTPKEKERLIKYLVEGKE